MSHDDACKVDPCKRTTFWLIEITHLFEQNASSLLKKVAVRPSYANQLFRVKLSFMQTHLVLALVQNNILIECSLESRVQSSNSSDKPTFETKLCTRFLLDYVMLLMLPR